MSRRFRSRVFRKPFHWSEERYEKYLQDKNFFRTTEELEKSLKKNMENKE